MSPANLKNPDGPEPSQQIKSLSIIRPFLRAFWRMMLLFCCVFSALSAAGWRFLTGRWSRKHRAEWLHLWARKLLCFLNIRAVYRGLPPGNGILVSNHVSYLDILLLSARHPLVFVAKSEVSRWPFFGWSAQCAGTIFIRRAQKSDVHRVSLEIASMVKAGIVVCFFPEGSSTSGKELLPFRSALFQPADENLWLVTPACITYSLKDGRVEDDVAYWRDMVLAPHLCRLLSKQQIDASVTYGHAIAGGIGRKQMANALEDAIRRMLIPGPSNSVSVQAN